MLHGQLNVKIKIHSSFHTCGSSEVNWCRHPTDALYLEVVPRFLANYLTPEYDDW